MYHFNANSRFRNSKRFHATCSVPTAERELGAENWQVIELDDGIFGKLLRQIIGKHLCPNCVPCQCECQRSSILDVPSMRTSVYRPGPLPRLVFVAFFELEVPGPRRF